MRSLLPFLPLFKQAKFPLFLGVVLMIGGLACSIGLLTLSGWFLSATAIAGAGALFNYFYPSSSVRGLAIGRTAMRYAEKIVTHDATFRILAKLRVQVFSKIIPLSPAVLNRYRNSDLLNRLVADVDTLDSLYLRLIAPFISAITVIGMMTLALSLFNLSLALLIGAILLILLLIIPTVFYFLGLTFGNKLTQSRSLYRMHFVEFIQAQAELLLFNAQDNLQQKLNQTEQQWQNYQQRESNLSGFSTSVLMFANGLLVVLTLWISSNIEFAIEEYRLAFIGLFTLSALASFEILMPLGAAFLHIGQVISSAQRVSEIIDQAPLVQFDGTETAVNFSNILFDLKNISFRYPQRQDIALKQVNLQIKPKQKVAILGKTGSGKSTLLQLLVRNYDPILGEIHFGDKQLSAYRESTLRQQICFLTQRVHIFSDSLRNNLQFATATPLSDEKMTDVLMQVGLQNLAEQGLEQWLGDGGRPLSGGEQRRLGLARILLSDAPILLLDEPTEGLDRETERQVLKLILQHCQNKTLIMVTHRLTAIEQFDNIVMIDNAELVEQGNYTELYQQQGYFHSLVQRI
ncbi:cysteine/glutathione ABC transporter ATP-binding protein/permease CydC [Lonepinella koalarum]|uniref:heme ABC transporter ATP-binding protein/permease CydC n=1 Tax=Lonepinella koalarum TaxID=53417 RepID=UPI0011E48D01|nr:cysteine/glutathione ABC transporter ATP-binding protein/permease CydC [Lonepinella koalarum]TYG33649.1 cysteine/glutathione ABC transporter ATP-binding protein/permease CydC [Lonepinella koalarum]